MEGGGEIPTGHEFNDPFGQEVRPTESQKPPEPPKETSDPTIERFSPETKKALKEKGYHIHELRGESVAEIIEGLGVDLDWGELTSEEIDAIKAERSLKSEVALKPNTVGSPSIFEHLLPHQAEAEIAEGSGIVRDRYEGADGTMGNVATHLALLKEQIKSRNKIVNYKAGEDPVVILHTGNKAGARVYEPVVIRELRGYRVRTATKVGERPISLEVAHHEGQADNAVQRLKIAHQPTGGEESGPYMGARTYLLIAPAQALARQTS